MDNLRNDSRRTSKLQAGQTRLLPANDAGAFMAFCLSSGKCCLAAWIARRLRGYLSLRLQVVFQISGASTGPGLIEAVKSKTLALRAVAHDILSFLPVEVLNEGGI
jgi:hypothetical protein